MIYSKQLIFLLTAIFFNTAILCQEKVVVGMSTALSGPSGNLGKNMRYGIEACFWEYNQSQRLQNIQLICYDDAYKPEKVKENMERLVANEEVLAIIGNIGTPTAKVAVPIAQEKELLFYGAFSGASFLRDSSLLETKPPIVINFRASYEDEINALVDYISNRNILPFETALFIQDDPYGKNIRDLAIKSFIERGFEIENNDSTSLFHSIGTYERNSWNVKRAIIKVCNEKTAPKAVIIGATSKAAAKFIENIKILLPNTIFLNVSFLSSQGLLEDLGENAANIILSQVVPFYNSPLLGTDSYRFAMESFARHIGREAQLEQMMNPISFEGYLAARVFIRRFVSGKEYLTRKSIRQPRPIYAPSFGIDEVFFKESDIQALHKVWLIETVQDSTNQFIYRAIK